MCLEPAPSYIPANEFDIYIPDMTKTAYDALAIETGVRRLSIGYRRKVPGRWHRVRSQLARILSSCGVHRAKGNGEHVIFGGYG